jgi:hypothetical protein
MHFLINKRKRTLRRGTTTEDKSSIVSPSFSTCDPYAFPPPPGNDGAEVDMSSIGQQSATSINASQLSLTSKDTRHSSRMQQHKIDSEQQENPQAIAQRKKLILITIVIISIVAILLIMALAAIIILLFVVPAPGSKGDDDNFPVPTTNPMLQYQLPTCATPSAVNDSHKCEAYKQEEADIR